MRTRKTTVVLLPIVLSLVALGLGRVLAQQPVSISAGGGSLTASVDVTSLPANASVDITRVSGATQSASNPLAVRISADGTNFLNLAASTCNSIISAGSVNETAIKASAGYLDFVSVYSLDATPVYLKLYNDTTANIDETDTPLMRIMTGANSTAALGAGNNLVLPGSYFSTAITFRTTTGIADNDTGVLTASEVLVNWCFR